MKKKSGILLATLVSAIALGTLSSCNKSANVSAEDLAKLVILTNDGAKVTDDFKLPSYVADSNKNTYKIEWKSDDLEHLTFQYTEDDPTTPNVDESLEDVKAKVVRSEEGQVNVSFHGEITVNGKTASTEEFGVRILKKVTPREEFENTYNNASSKLNLNLSGYVLAKAGYMLYQEKGEVALYIYDEVAQGAYYIYNSEMSEADYNALEVGDYVTVTNCQSTVYNGVVEFQYGTTAKDTTKAKKTELAKLDLTQKALEGKVTAFDQSQIVTLNGAKITEISTEAVPSSAGKYLSTMHTVLKAELNDTTYSVVLTQGVSPFTAAATTTLCTSLRGKAVVGDYINITGVLFGSTDIVALDDSAVAKAKGSDDFKALAVTTTLINVAGTYDLPAKAGELDVTYTVTGSDACSIANGKLVVGEFTGNGMIHLTASVTVDGVTLSKTFDIILTAKTTAEMVAEAKAQVATTYEGTFKEFKLPTTDATYVGVKLTYALATDTTNAVLASNTLTVLGFEDAQGKMVVTLTCGEVTDTVEVTLTSKAAELATLAQFNAAKKGDVVYTSGTVVAASTRGYIITDGTNNAYVYAYGNNKSTVKFAVGDIVNVYGKKDFYNGDELVPAYEKKVTGTAATAPAAEDLTAAAAQAYLAGDAFPVKHVTLTGKLLVSGNYFNIEVEGLTGQGSVSYPLTALSDVLKTKAGKNVTIDGYLFGYSTKKIDNVATNYFCNIIATNVTINETDAEKAAVQAAAIEALFVNKFEAESTEVEFVKEYDNATFAVTVTEGVTNLSYNAETRVMTVTATAEEVTSTFKFTVTVGEATSEEKTVTVKAKLPAAGTLKATAAYSDTTASGNMDDNANNAAKIGLDSTVFVVTAVKNKASNNVGLNKAGEIRLYTAKDTTNGNSLEIKLADSTKKIISVKITFGSTVGDFTVNGTAGSKEQTDYEINSNSVVIVNTTEGNVQVWIKSIEIVYES